MVLKTNKIVFKDWEVLKLEMCAVVRIVKKFCKSMSKAKQGFSSLPYNRKKLHLEQKYFTVLAIVALM